MADRLAIKDLQAALKGRLYPSITMWNRLEGRPRTINFERALRCEVRDALWMLTRQWQAGELHGEDAGSPVRARVAVTTTPLTRLRLGDAGATELDLNVPLEAQVQPRPLRWFNGTDKAALDLRLALGRRWLRLIKPIGAYASQFTTRYPFTPPDPARREDAAVCAHVEVWQAFAASSGRAMDGGALYSYVRAAGTHHAYDGITVLDAHKPALDVAAAEFLAWVDRLFAQPGTDDNPAWRSHRLEYQFAAAARTGDLEKAYAAEEYYGGPLDWHSFDIDPSAPALGAATGGSDPEIAAARTMLPVPVRYPGMPHPRWWTIEDGHTNFGAIRPDTTDLAKLLFIEFGLVYSNDWFVVPFTLPGATIAKAEGIVVTSTFGERFWIDAAGSGADDDWQRWAMFTVNVRATGAAADTSLVLLPVVPKVQEGRPLEEVLFIRDEMANMVWGIEKTIPAPDGRPRAGSTAARETRAYHQRLVDAAGNPPSTPPLENAATVRYDAMSTIPEHWIPFIGVRAKGSTRAIELQRAGLLRLIEGDGYAPIKVRPRTSVLRAGLDEPTPQAYLVPDEEVPRAGTRVTQAFERTRWLDGRVFVWLGMRRQTGRGEGSSGLAFDRLLSKEDSSTP